MVISIKVTAINYT